MPRALDALCTLSALLLVGCGKKEAPPPTVIASDSLSASAMRFARALSEAEGRSPAAARPIEQQGTTQMVTINQEALTRLAGAVTLTESARTFRIDLARYGPIEAQFASYERASGDIDVWTGGLSGGRRGTIALSRIGNRVHGLIFAGDSLFELRPYKEGHVVQLVSRREYPHELAPLAPLATPSGAAAAGVHFREDSCPVHTIDVLQVIHTTDLAALNGLDSARAEFALALGVANLALGKNGLSMKFRSAGTAVLSPPTPTPPDFDKLLDDMQAGRVPRLRETRNDSAADVVALWKPSGTECGLAFQLGPGGGGNGASAFLVVSSVCGPKNFSLAHELGHILGVAHDRASWATESPRQPPARPYGYGYWDPSGLIADIMTQKCKYGQCNRQTVFSSPRAVIIGIPLGIDYAADQANSADGARAISETACDVARYRPMASSRATAVP